MIRKNQAKRYDRLYFKPDPESKKSPEAMAKEADKATYTLRGESQSLKYDGKVEDVVLQGMKPEHRDTAITDIRSLASHLDSVEASREQMDAGEAVELELGGGATWTGKKNTKDGDKYGNSYEFKAGAQSVVFSTLDEETVRSVQLRSRGDGMSHDVTALAFNSDSVPDDMYYFAEGVTVFARNKSKK